MQIKNKRKPATNNALSHMADYARPRSQCSRYQQGIKNEKIHR